VARLTSLQVCTTDLAAAAKFYGELIGLDLSGEAHRHGGPHDGEWGRNAVYEGPDGNIVSITAA